MAEEEKFSSLFDMASKKQQKKEEAPARAEVVPVSPALPPVQDLKAEFERCRAMYKEMKEKIEQAYESAKISPRQLKEYISNPRNFTAKQWSRIQKEKTEYQNKLKELLPRSAEKEMKPEDKEPGSVKAPKGFVSKKRWLSMH